MVVFWCWWFCVGAFVVVLLCWCFCGGVLVVVFLWWCFCGGVFVVVFVWWCLCGGVCVVVILWWCLRGGVFVVVFLWWCLRGGVCVVFLWWCLCGGVCVVVFVWCFFVVVFESSQHIVRVIRTKVQSIKVVTNHSIGTCSVDLYILYLFETSGTASCGTTGISSMDQRAVQLHMEKLVEKR